MYRKIVARYLMKIGSGDLERIAEMIKYGDDSDETVDEFLRLYKRSSGEWPGNVSLSKFGIAYYAAVLNNDKGYAAIFVDKLSESDKKEIKKIKETEDNRENLRTIREKNTGLDAVSSMFYINLEKIEKVLKTIFGVDPTHYVKEEARTPFSHAMVDVDYKHWGCTVTVITVTDITGVIRDFVHTQAHPRGLIQNIFLDGFPVVKKNISGLLNTNTKNMGVGSGVGSSVGGSSFKTFVRLSNILKSVKEGLDFFEEVADEVESKLITQSDSKNRSTTPVKPQFSTRFCLNSRSNTLICLVEGPTKNFSFAVTSDKDIMVFDGFDSSKEYSSIDDVIGVIRLG